MKPVKPQDETARKREELERKNREQIESSLTGGEDEAGQPGAGEHRETRWPGRRDVT